MPTLEVSYGQPSGYYSGSSPASKTVSRLDYAGYPDDSYSNYKVTSYYAEWEAQVYISAGATADFDCNGASFSKSMDEAQSTTTFTKSGTSLSNKILDFNNTSTMEVDISRDGGSGTGNVALFKSSIYLKVEYEYAYTACSAPTSVTVSTSTPAAGGTTTLSWSGAKAGTLNAITGYEIYRATSSGGSYTLLESVSTSATSGSLKVTAPATMGSSYYYKVKTIGTVSGYDSGLSSAVGITAKTITACSAPTALTLAATADAGTAFTLSWSGATAGTNNAITKYEIYRSTDDKNYTSAYTSTTTSTSITLNPTNDTTYYFKVKTIGTVSGYDSDYSSAASIKVITYTSCGSTDVKAAASIAEGTVNLTWNAAADGRNNAVTGYQISYQDSTDGSTWGTTTTLDTVTELEYEAALNATRGCYRRYILTPIGTKEGYNGTATTSIAVKTNNLPNNINFLCFGSGGTVYNTKPWIRFTIPADADGQDRTVFVQYSSSDWKPLCVCSPDAGTYAVQLPDALKTNQMSSISFKVSDGLAETEEMLCNVFVSSVVTSLYVSKDKCEAATYTNLGTIINNLRKYYQLGTVTFTTKTAGNLVKAEETNELLTALEDIHKLLPTTNKFDKVKRGDLITKKTYNQIINGLTGG